MTSIGRIRVKGVRGIRSELVLDLEGRSLLMRGDNGSGKSSIAQALRWALLGALTSASSARLPPEFERHQLETDPAAARVIIELLPKGRITMIGGRIDDAATDDAGREYIDACVRSSPFLRRDELLGFLTSSPGERFKYLERFLDLDRVDRLLASLGQLAKEHEAKAKDAGERRARMLERSYGCLQTTGPAPESTRELVATLATEAKRLGFAARDSVDLSGLRALQTALGTVKVDASASVRRLELASALARARAVTPPDHPRSVLTPLCQAEKDAEETELASMLTDALTVVESHPPRENCPVCEQAVDAASLATKLRRRLALLNDVRTLTTRARALGQEWADFLGTLDELECIARAEPRVRRPLPAGRACLEELEHTAGDALSSTILVRLEDVRSSLASALAAIPDELRASEIGKLVAAVSTTLAAEKPLADADTALTLHTSRARALRSVEKALSEARKDTATAVLNAVQSQVAAFYERIHPPGAADEVTGAPSIKIKRHGAGTAYVRGTFNSLDIDDPRHVYSDGHLDTVGICVFLALRKQASSDAKLLVLDDIVLSIDLGHSERLVKLLREEFADHQILLFSHNELFMRLCRAPFSRAKHLEIVRWTLEDGPRVAGHIPNVEVLRQALDNCGSAEQLAGAMRPVLDALLDEAVAAFEVSVPRTLRRGLTLHELWTPLRPVLVKLSKGGHLPDLTRILEDIGEPSFFRNALGAHRNEWALETSLRQVQRVAKGVLDLVTAITCAECQRIPCIVDARDLRLRFTCDCPRKAGPTLPHRATPTLESAS